MPLEAIPVQVALLTYLLGELVRDRIETDERDGCCGAGHGSICRRCGGGS